MLSQVAVILFPNSLMQCQLLRLPVFVPDPCMIRASQLWVQGNYVPNAVIGMPANASGDIAVAIDPGSGFTKQTNFPTVTAPYPSLLKTINALVIPNRDDWRTFNPPMQYSASAGDSIIYAPEGENLTPPAYSGYPMIIIYFENEGDLVPPYPLTTLLAIQGDPANGLSIIRDFSSANHQVVTNCALTTDNPPPTTDNPPPTTDNPSSTNPSSSLTPTGSSIAFNGTSDFIAICDRLYDFYWQQRNFTLSLMFSTTQTGFNGQRLFSGGTGAGSAILYINGAGELVYGLEPNGSTPLEVFLTSPHAVNDGNWHTVSIQRVNGNTTMTLDGTAIGSVTDSTSYQNLCPRFGMYANGGAFFAGQMRSIIMSQP